MNGNGHITTTGKDGAIGQGLQPRQKRALRALLDSSSVAQAAKSSGVGLSTIWRWLKVDRAFKEAYELGQRCLLTDAMHGLTQGASSAVGVLVGVMEDTEAPRSVRVAAAGKLLDNALRMHELVNLGDRLAAVEAALELRDGKKGKPR